ESDYSDLLKIEVLHVDEYNGITHKGGHDFFYDDGDDTDSWTHDSNWSFNWRADLPSRGTLDQNGGTNGLTELNWYYIGISHTQMVDTLPPVRDDVEVEYEFTISSPTNQSDNIYPNDLKNATSLGDKKSGSLSSLRDHQDWFEITGSDYDKIWNISYFWNRSTNLRFESDEWYSESYNVHQTMWMHFHLVYSTWGPDGTWGTSDDGWESEEMVLTQWFDTEGWLTSDTSWSGDIINNMTGGTVNQRKVYMGVILEAIDLRVDGSGNVNGFDPTTFGAVNDYSISVTISEVAPNNPPSISDISVLSTNPQHVSNGGLNDNYTISFTYTDGDNDPPEKILLALDEELGVSDMDVSAFEMNSSDVDHTDGKDYSVNFTGVEIGADPVNHTIRMIASDNLTSDPIKVSKWSDPVVLEDLFSVWDDNPPAVHPNFNGIQVVEEDSMFFLKPLGNSDISVFIDDEGFIEFYVWNKLLKKWDSTYDSELIYVEIVEIYGDHFARITPKPDQFGTEILRLMGIDQHMSVEADYQINITPTNDPTIVQHINIDGTPRTVNNNNPLKPVAHLENISVLEDEDFSFQINSSDPDGLDISYSFEIEMSDPWDSLIEVEGDSGIVTFTPTNEDVLLQNSKMVFSITENLTEDQTYLEVYFKITNVNDPPEITIPTRMPRTYNQFRKVRIKPIVSDIDPYDILTITVNMINATNEWESAISEQLPYANLNRGIDWDIDPATGEFWFQLDDQEIWRTDEGMVDQVEIALVFNVTDGEGGFDTASINLILTDENQEPEKPVEIFHILIGMTVNFWVDPVADPDGDQLKYRWDFGDGQTGEGINVNHTYAREGPKNVQMWVQDDEYQTDRIALQITVDEFSGDRDGDGVPDLHDAFPDNPYESIDTDGDGVGDNGDAFPDDPSESKDSDGDDVGDNTDAFIEDPAASVDTDGDGHPDEWNDGYSRSDSTTGLSLDLFPDDDQRWN
ncbi:MAG: PKD domain-containing protein, partial [Thermoplasmata archaeon]|nr:PKD domain-containing protein [Thermoplasmata archaeon]